jgi:hypothetical protein
VGVVVVDVVLFDGLSVLGGRAGCAAAARTAAAPRTSATCAR